MRFFTLIVCVLVYLASCKTAIDASVAHSGSKSGNEERSRIVQIVENGHECLRQHRVKCIQTTVKTLETLLETTDEWDEVIGGAAASFFHASGRPSSALRVMEKKMLSSPSEDPCGDSQHFRSLAQLSLEAGFLVKAESFYKDAISLCPTSAGAWFGLATLHEKRNFLQLAKDCYMKCLKLEPSHIDCINNLSSLLQKSGNQKGALQLLFGAVKIQSRNAKLSINLGSVLLQQGQWQDILQSVAWFLHASLLEETFIQAHAGCLHAFERWLSSSTTSKFAIEEESWQSVSQWHLPPVSQQLKLANKKEHILMADGCMHRLVQSSDELPSAFSAAVSRWHKMKSRHISENEKAEDSMLGDACLVSVQRLEVRTGVDSRPLEDVLQKCKHDASKLLEAAQHLMFQGALEDAIHVCMNGLQTPAVLQRIRESAGLYSVLGKALMKLKRIPQAIEALSASERLLPSQYETLFDLALAFYYAGDLQNCEVLYGRVLEINETLSAVINLGACVYEQNKIGQALAIFQRAVRIAPEDPTVHFNMANILTEAGKLEEAIDGFTMALSFNPAHEEAFINRFRVKMNICQWADMPSELPRLKAIVKRQLASNSTSAVRPWHALAYPLPPKMLKDISRSFAAYTRKVVSRHFSSPDLSKTYSMHPFLSSQELRIGWVSYCFKKHPTGQLISGVFSNLISLKGSIQGCFAMSPNDGSNYRLRIQQNCHKFHDLHQLGTEAVARAVNDWRPDVLINLEGWTSMGRVNEVFAAKPAAVQVMYMGFPGTMGADFLPFLLTDSVISPPELARTHYTEKFILLPNSYYVNSYRSELGQRPTHAPSHSKQCSAFWDRNGLSTRKVASNYGNLYKVTPRRFSTWLNIIGKTNSTLAVITMPEEGAANLEKLAVAHGIKKSQFLAVPSMSLKLHSDRCACTDVILDTQRVSMHTVAMDAIFAGSPLVTSPSDTFASRVAAACLISHGCAHSVARNEDDYLQMGVQLLTNDQANQHIRKCITMSTDSGESKLFDTQRWAQDFVSSMKLAAETIKYAGKPRHVITSKSSI